MKGWRFTIKDDILKIIPDEFCTSESIYILLGKKYKNVTTVSSVKMILSQMAQDNKIDRASVYKKNGGHKHYIYKKKAI